MSASLEQRYAERIRDAAASGTALQIRGGGSKEFYGQAIRGERLLTQELCGVVDYEPTELVITALAGTPLKDIEAILAERGQMLAFEPPHYGAGATLGGCVSAGLSGPRRASAGAVRDFVLGVKLIDGRGELLSFGGQVMKNVAGYDVSRLVCGALGTLGLIAEASVKVLPKPVEETSLRFELSEAQALLRLNQWGGQPLPVSASTYTDGELFVRLSGAAAAVKSACAALGGERIEPGAAADLWHGIREQTDEFFAGDEALWRLSLPSTADVINLPGRQLIEWGGALRWFKTAASARQVREAAAAAGGQATLYRGGDKSVGVFTPLPTVMKKLHANLKKSFDPKGIFNPGRMYEE